MNKPRIRYNPATNWMHISHGFCYVDMIEFLWVRDLCNVYNRLTLASHQPIGHVNPTAI